ncbi:transcriptional regulator swi6 [Verticillium nonalfalfae]|uniref:Transcription factor SWI6 n=2 Tax=Verticillium TaxID=1036719 RepID=C9SUD1_VERA1|nr:start control protein cdc10 [Verticillium alfalfae VaMs.102]XP_028496224.1 transcriptional regulator swi6 [Verticillium nonalfalfae]EEY22442.1 start control protein cdc10 [Verticillium alfalfae VaMs.102]RNJ58066.1 transcriptional regulator swi6 [Verticillium nonalfalfae]
MQAASQSRPSSQQSFTMSQQSQPGLASSGYRPYDGGSKMAAADHQIYSAVYSGVDVYEMEVQGVAVMRRRNDSWLNATQILKVAGVEKGKRTKILEKEIQTGEHEKVQGGYGKYQGTWIKFERAVEVCRQYGVEEILRPLLTYDMGQDGGIAGRGDINTPTKEQAMAAQRKRMYNLGNEARGNGLSGTFFKNISSTASHAVAAISKARFESPGPRSRNGPTRAPSFSRQSSMQNADDFPGNSQQSFASDYGQQANSQMSSQQTQPFPEPSAEPPRKRQRVTMTPADSFGYTHSNMDMLQENFPGSPTEPNESFIYSQAVSNAQPHDGYSPLSPLPFEVSPDAEQKRSMLMGLFMDAAASDQNKHEMLRSFTPAELDMPIDQQCHTALHWAATLSRMHLLKTLLSYGASPFRVNAAGETALMRACVVTNSMDLGSFPDLLEVLGSTIEVRDAKGRTALHHIAMTSAVKGRNAASRYYLESLLEWVVRQGSQGRATLSDAAAKGRDAEGGTSGSQSQQQKMGIGRFMMEVVNVQDNSGDTALNIAARIGNRSIISQLLEVHADPHIANKAGLRPLDFGIGGDAAEDNINGTNGDANTEKNGAAPSSQKSRESSDEIISSITHLLHETSSTFQAEIKSKQASIDSLHAVLRTSTTQLADARRTLETLQQTHKKQQLARQKVANLSHAREDEQVRLMQEQKRQGRPDALASGAWETELAAVLEAASESGADGAAGLLPPGATLKARSKAVENRRDGLRKMALALKGRSRDVEVKYRRVVAMCTGVPEGEVDAMVDGLLRAVESEKGELEIGRVRRFLGGVENGVS